jgi:predicted dehydrogenase
MDNRVRFGVVGTGRMASTMLRAFRELPNIDVTAVCSASPERAAAFAQRFGIESFYGDLTQFLHHDAIDAVYVANHNVDHPLTAIAALNAGKAVLCEKPFAVNGEQGAAVLEAARANKVLFMEAIWTPFLPAYRRLSELVRSGSFGRATHLRFDFGYPASPAQNPSLFAPSGGGVLLDRAGYGISFALNTLGPVKWVETALSLNEDGVDIGASLQLTHRDGGQSQIGVSLRSLLANSATVGCTAGMIGLSAPTIGAEGVFWQRAGSPNTAGNSLRSTPSLTENLKRHSLIRRIKAVRSRPKTERHPYGTNPYVAQVRHFTELMRAGSVESGVNTLDHSFAILRIMDAARNAGSNGRQRGD